MPNSPGSDQVAKIGDRHQTSDDIFGVIQGNRVPQPAVLDKNGVTSVGHNRRVRQDVPNDAGILPQSLVSSRSSRIPVATGRLLPAFIMPPGISSSIVSEPCRNCSTMTSSLSGVTAITFTQSTHSRTKKSCSSRQSGGTADVRSNFEDTIISNQFGTDPGPSLNHGSVDWLLRA